MASELDGGNIQQQPDLHMHGAVAGVHVHARNGNEFDMDAFNRIGGRVDLYDLHGVLT